MSITKLNKPAFVLTTLSCVRSPQSGNIPSAHFTSLSALTGWVITQIQFACEPLLLPGLLMRLSVDVQKAITFHPWHVTRQLSSRSPVIRGQRAAGTALWPRARENEAIRLPLLRKGTGISNCCAFCHFSHRPSSAPVHSGSMSCCDQTGAAERPRLTDLIQAIVSRQTRAVPRWPPPLRSGNLKALSPSTIESSSRAPCLIAQICSYVGLSRWWGPQKANCKRIISNFNKMETSETTNKQFSFF